MYSERELLGYRCHPTLSDNILNVVPVSFLTNIIILLHPILQLSSISINLNTNTYKGKGIQLIHM